jgi:RNA polymerase sigma-70 factor (ECF subfamily)
MLTTSASLLERLRQSPEQVAWERFVDLYTPLFFAWARRLGLDTHEAADLVQDVFAVLVEKMPQFQLDAQKSFRAWLKTVLLNRHRNQLRKRRPQIGAMPEEVVDTSQPPEFEEDEYRRFVVGRALDLMQTEFQPATWQACWQLVVQGRPAVDIASELGLSVNAVYLAKSRVLRRLRQELAGLLD